MRSSIYYNLSTVYSLCLFTLGLLVKHVNIKRINTNTSRSYCEFLCLQEILWNTHFAILYFSNHTTSLVLKLGGHVCETHRVYVRNVMCMVYMSGIVSTINHTSFPFWQLDIIRHLMVGKIYHTLV